MPFSVGGGVRTLIDIKKILAAGAEEVVIGSEAVINPNFVKKAAESFGSSTIVVCADIKKKKFGERKVWTVNGTKESKFRAKEYAKMIEAYGAGEIILQSINNDGTMQGYDIQLIKNISNEVKIPLVALGGAGEINDLKLVFYKGNANGLAAGSLFVYNSKMKGVLLNYPDKKDIKNLFSL